MSAPDTKQQVTGPIAPQPPHDQAAAAKVAEQRRWAAREGLRSMCDAATGVQRRQMFCGTPGKPVGGSGDVTLRATALPAKERLHGKQFSGGFAGLLHCGNIWTCPCCGVKIGAARAAELAKVMGHVVEQGGTAALFTFTMRHKKEHDLAKSWDAITDAWSSVISGREWHGGERALRDDQGKYVRVPGTERLAIRDDQGNLIERAYPGEIAKEYVPGLAQEYGVFGWDKNIDITHGFKNGWHVHAHVIVMFNGRPTADRITELGHKMFARWKNSFEGSEFGTPDRDRGGFDVQLLDFNTATGKIFDSIADMAKYVSKGLAMESNLAGFKQGKRGNRTMMELLLDATEKQAIAVAKTGEIIEGIDLTARQLFKTYQEASQGRKMNSSSKEVRELRRQLAPETADMTDEEIADQEIGGQDVAVIPRLEWHKIKTRAVYLKQTLEYEGIDSAHDWLNKTGITWYRPTALTEHLRTVAD